jgi:hypothetical protein
MRTPKKKLASNNKLEKAKALTLPLIRESSGSVKRSRSHLKFTDEKSPMSEVKGK